MITKENTEDTKFALKQTIAKLRHELLSKEDMITKLKQDIIDIKKEHDGFVGGWSKIDVLHHAEVMEVEISDDDAEDIIYEIGHRFDASLGINWDTIELAINDFIELREGVHWTQNLKL